MMSFQIFMLTVLIVGAKSDPYCESIVWQNNELQELRQMVKNLSRRIEETEKMQRLSVSFTADFTTDDGTNGVAVGAGQILAFDRVITNIGGGYNPLTGIFAAPVAGVYAFFLSTFVPNSHGRVSLSINKQITVLGQVYAGTPNPTNEGSVLVTTRMAAGEQVWVKQTAGTAVRGGPWTVFTGFLINAGDDRSQ